MSSSFEFSHIFQVYTHNLIENLGRIERIRESVCTSEVLLEKCKNCRQEIICSKMSIFESKVLQNSSTSICKLEKFLGSLSLAINEREPS
jgi:hypothetical protein